MTNFKMFCISFESLRILERFRSKYANYTMCNVPLLFNKQQQQLYQQCANETNARITCVFCAIQWHKVDPGLTIFISQKYCEYFSLNSSIKQWCANQTKGGWMETDTRHIGQASHCLLRHVCHRSNDEHYQLIDDDQRMMVTLIGKYLMASLI